MHILCLFGQEMDLMLTAGRGVTVHSSRRPAFLVAAYLIGVFSAMVQGRALIFGSRQE